MLSMEEDAGAVPSKRTIYLNRDFLKAGQNRVSLKDITDFTVYMWDNRYMKHLIFNRDNIAPVDQEYRKQVLTQIDYFRRQCWGMINLETKLLLTKEVRIAFRDNSSHSILKWNEAVKCLNEHTKSTGDARIAYTCCYGPNFSGNWAKNRQSKIMTRINAEWRVWDLEDKPCPNGFFSHMYSATKGHHVKPVKYISARMGRQSFGPRNIGTLGNYDVSGINNPIQRDPNFIDVRDILTKLSEFATKGNATPSIVDFKKMIYLLKKNNIHLCNQLVMANRNAACTTNEATVTDRVSTTSTDDEDDRKMAAIDDLERSCDNNDSDDELSSYNGDDCQSEEENFNPKNTEDSNASEDGSVEEEAMHKPYHGIFTKDVSMFSFSELCIFFYYTFLQFRLLS